jgi:O-antigen/teichoic acid export membrane protein
LKSNFIANLIGKFWSIISNFIFIPIYISILGFESYTVITLTLVISGFLVVIDSGFSGTLTREFSRKDSTINDKVKVYSTLVVIFSFLILSLLIIFLFSFGTFSSYFSTLHSQLNLDFSVILLFIILDIVSHLYIRFYSAVLLGLEGHVKLNFLNIFFSIFRSGLVIIVISFFPSLLAFFVWQGFSSIVFLIIFKFSLKKTFIRESLFMNRGLFDFNYLKKISNYGFGITLISIVSVINNQLDKILISTFLSLEVLGYYTLALTISSSITALTTPFLTTFLPRFTALFSQKKQTNALILFHNLGKVISILSFSFFSIMFFYHKDLLYIWTGDSDLTSRVSEYVVLTSLSYSFIAVSISPFIISLANGYTKLNNILGLLSLFLTIPGYVVSIYHFGATGAAFTFCFVQVTTTFIYYFQVNKRFLQKKSILLFLDQIIKPFVSTFTITYLLSLISLNFGNERFNQLFFLIIMSLLSLTFSILINFKMQELKRFFNFKI